jgi:opacity protein-like surface antigen
MRRLILSAILVAALPGPILASDPGANPDEQYLTHFTGDVDGMVGWRRMNDSGFWSPVSNSVSYGVQSDFGLAPYMVRGEAGFEYSSNSGDTDAGQNASARLMDFTLGARVAPQFDWFRPYIGAGLVVVNADFNSPANVSDSDTAVGFYSHAGLGAVVAKHVHFGVEYRLVRGVSMNLNGAAGDANHDEAMAFAGYSW